MLVGAVAESCEKIEDERRLVDGDATPGLHYLHIIQLFESLVPTLELSIRIPRQPARNIQSLAMTPTQRVEKLIQSIGAAPRVLLSRIYVHGH